MIAGSALGTLNLHASSTRSQARTRRCAALPVPVQCILLLLLLAVLQHSSRKGCATSGSARLGERGNTKKQARELNFQVVPLRVQPELPEGLARVPVVGRCHPVEDGMEKCNASIECYRHAYRF